MDVLMCTASIWHMCTMSMDRYFTLKYPMQYGRNKTRMMVFLKITFVWVVSVAISSPICILGIVDTRNVFVNQQCIPTLKEFLIYGSVLAFYIPLFIMLFTYVLTIRILWRNQTLMRTVDGSDFRVSRNNHLLKKSCNISTRLSPPSQESNLASSVDISQTEISSLVKTPNTETGEKTTIMMTFIKNATKDKDDETINAPPIYIEGPSSQGETPHSMETLQNIAEPLCEELPSSSQDRVNKMSSKIVIFAEGSDMKETHNDTNWQYRTRANTHSSSQTLHSSLKLPKSLNSPLQSSISCSNLPPENQTWKTLQQNCITSWSEGDLILKDRKSFKWCQHFHEIQNEMDQCLQEVKNERKYTRSKITLEPDYKMPSYSARKITGQGQINQKCENIESSELKVELVSDSGDSIDDVDSSSENTAKILSLHSKSMYMYQLAVPKSVSSSNVSTSSQIAIKRRLSDRNTEHNQSRKSSEDSGKSHLSVRQSATRQSIRKFLRKMTKNKQTLGKMSKLTKTNEKKASKVLGIIFAVFVILWTPFFITNIMSAICESCLSAIAPDTMSVFLWMGYAASLANPIIYTMFNTSFRRTFLHILSGHLCKYPRSRMVRGSCLSYMPTYTGMRRQTAILVMNGNGDQHHSFGNELSSNGISR
ncbi:hypothetical protein ACJMK2_018490 [Sinanodonta woodiana]|uniref:G-protein coupled receptors family 1 profile domain-containing protein n=1 Tax=Sinanodonta woodiana TaxID=1069815 RepID=A0ABD3UF47_SINWO